MARRRKYVTEDQKRDANLKKSRDFYRKNKDYINEKKRKQYQTNKLEELEELESSINEETNESSSE